MAKKKKQLSAAAQLIELVRTHSPHVPGPPWERAQHILREVVFLAVDAGLHFDDDDFDTGKVPWCFDGEMFYTIAVQSKNIAAAQAYEKTTGRKPFIADDVDVGSNRSSLHMVGRRKRERLAVGFRFPWKGHCAEVTSFSIDGVYLTACTYKDQRYPRKVARRFKIAVEDIREDRKERKKQAKKSSA